MDLEKLAFTLNAETDKLLVVFDEVEAYLKSLNLGVTAFVDCGSGYKLGYGRINNKWCLILSQYEYKWPIRESPRMPRVHSVKYIPDLIRELTRLSAEAIITIEEAMKFDWREKCIE